ncbi:VQ motif-containing protein 33-like [Nymphaea colorata]|uniref:VQ motif-containing protein 33-like n=1 Tax=Nymphaea colorata TaxID=210225 RepID=UPI00129EDFCE|nr:VQ motif-containing protein 33-like [Nymphaea colorata]
MTEIDSWDATFVENDFPKEGNINKDVQLYELDDPEYTKTNDQEIVIKDVCVIRRRLTSVGHLLSKTSSRRRGKRKKGRKGKASHQRWASPHTQHLTGANDDSQERLPVTVPARLANRVNNAAAAPGDVGPGRPAFKFHERRQGLRKLDIKLGIAALRPPHPSPLSQQLLLSPTTAFSNLSLSGSKSSSLPGPNAAVSEEEKAIAEKGFYLHPSPLVPRQSSSSSSFLASIDTLACLRP